MILDEFGRPIYKPIGFISPRWVQQSVAKLLMSSVDAYSQISMEQKIDDLYESADEPRPNSTTVGGSVAVRLPTVYRP